MEADHQKKIFQAMKKSDFYPHPVETVMGAIEQRETHISKVFLTGSYVYKIKKAVGLEFLDFTTLEKRQYYCDQELLLNRRLAHNIYLDVVPITFRNGCYNLGGSGDPVEYAVKMRQLPDDESMKYMLRNSTIGKKEIEELSYALTEFYEKTPPNGQINTFGSWETIQANCQENFKTTKKFAQNIIDKKKFQMVIAATESFLHKRKKLFQHRIDQGKIRDCHGDLKTEHVYYTKDGVQIIDCIEFNKDFRYQDIACDLAFLLMGFDYEGFSRTGHDLLSAYVKRTNDQNVFILLDFYKCYRAVVRCKVNCIRISEGFTDKDEEIALLEETEKYLDLAYRYALQFTRPTIWIVCGISASGKSTISRELGKLFDIKVINSDVIRKKIFGIKTQETSDLPFEKGIYSKGASSLTYGQLLLLAQEEIEKGNSVIIDATFSTRHWRIEAIRMAEDMDVNIVFVECLLSDELTKKRLVERENVVSVSDARVHHFEDLKRLFEPLESLPNEMHIRLNTIKPLNECMQQILSHKERGGNNFHK
ncbi:MAG: AAA family ATPase [Deltaproteobacteria bacterium]|nr:AAA family ATPase [Deltaproteobacteria bacterium]